MAESEKSFVGVDVGGTKIQAAVVSASGVVRRRKRTPTPREGGAKAVLQTILETVATVLDEAGAADALGGIGLSVPGLLDYQRNRVDAAPNIDIAGLNLIKPLGEQFNVPAAFANDTDAATLGEKWVGAAREANTAVGMFVGTGIGGGILVDRKLLHGTRYSAAEIGHMIMDIHGPVCGCGNRGCLEAMAARVAMERDIRRAIADGTETVLTEWIGGPDEPIRSGMLRRALDAGDELATNILTRAGEVLAQACLSLRHIFEPDVIILGGGVMEACGDFLMPIIEAAIPADPYFGSRPGGRVVQSALGDDAGVLGSAALAMLEAGLDPFPGAEPACDHSPELSLTDGGAIQAGKKTYDVDIVVRVNGRVRKRRKNGGPAVVTSAADVTEKDLDRACRGGPEILILGVDDETPLRDDCLEFLRRRAITLEMLPRKKAIKRFNTLKARKALLLLGGTS